MGGDWEFVMFVGVVVVGLIGLVIDEFKVWVVGLFIWFGGLWVVCFMVKFDLFFWGVYLCYWVYCVYYVVCFMFFWFNLRS